MIKFRMVIISFIEVAFPLTIAAVAHDCSSPGDCMQTAGYNAIVSIVGGILGLAAAIFGKAILDTLQNTFLKELWPISPDEKATPGAVATPRELAERARRAARAHPTDCSSSTAQVADDYGITALNNLPTANKQVQYMQNPENGWRTVTAEEAQDLANQGYLVIAGRAEPNGIGHVAVVVPGQMVQSGDGNSYPLVAGGALDSNNPGVPGAAYSENGHGVNHAWSRRHRQEVEYYVPLARTP